MEFGCYLLIMGKTATKYDSYYVVLIELLLFPAYTLGSDFTMRASIPAVFLMMIFSMKFLLDEDSILRTRKIILCLALIIGSWTAVSEINRSLYFTSKYALNALTEHNSWFLQNQIYSLDNLTINEGWIRIINSTFYAYNYKNSFFFKYLVKK